MEALLLFVLVICLLMIGVPIAVGLGLSSIAFLLIYSDASLASIAQTLFNAFAGHFTLLAIPFFILASAFMSTGGVAPAHNPVCDCRCRSFPGWPGHCRRLCMHAVRRPFRLVARHGGCHRLHRDRRHATGWLHQGIRRRCHLPMQARSAF